MKKSELDLSNLKNGLVTYQMNIALANQMNTNIAFNNDDKYNTNIQKSGYTFNNINV